MTAIFDPPYESPIEEAFAWDIIKYLKEEVDFCKQVEFETLCGKFRVDFVAYVGRRCIGLECDGADYHDIGRDEWRDAMLLGGQALDVVYHFPGSGLIHRMDDCLFILARCEPGLFTERGLINLNVLASEDAKRADISKSKEMIFISPAITIWRRFYEDNLAFWKAAYQFAVDHGGGDLEHLIGLHNSPKS